MDYETFLLKYVTTIYQLAGNRTGTGVLKELVNIALRIGDHQADNLFEKANARDWVGGWNHPEVWVTVNGYGAVHNFMEKTYAEEEVMILEQINTLGKQHHSGWVMIDELTSELPKLLRPLNDYLLELDEEKRFIESPVDEAVKIRPRGLEFLEKKANRDAGVSIQYGHTIHAGHGSPVVIGNGNTVVNQQAVNPDFDKAIAALAQIIASAQISEEDRTEANAELEGIVKSALKGETERGALKTLALKALLSGVGLAGQVAPHIDKIIALFQGNPPSQ